jgi:sugar-specific transcriptional regulator TrmB
MSAAAAVEERVVRAMQELGFTASEGKAYVALLKQHPATGYELASRSGVPRSAIYTVLRRLEGLGLVNALHGKPARYVPIEPARLSRLLESRFAETMEDLTQALRKLSTREPESSTWTLQGYDAVLQQARDLIAGSKRSVYASIWHREAERLKEPLFKAAADGVRVVLFSFTPLPEGIGQVLSYNIPERDLERHWTHRLIVVSDLRQALIGSAETGGDTRSVVTSEPSLVETAISNLVMDITLYGQRQGEDTGLIVAGLTAQLAPIDDWLDRSQADAD